MDMFVRCFEFEGEWDFVGREFGCDGCYSIMGGWINICMVGWIVGCNVVVDFVVGYIGGYDGVGVVGVVMGVVIRDYGFGFVVKWELEFVLCWFFVVGVCFYCVDLFESGICEFEYIDYIDDFVFIVYYWEVKVVVIWSIVLVWF